MGKSKPGGYTLIELMVVCAIIALVTAMVMPSMRDSLVRNRLREAGFSIVGAVFEARSRATRTGNCHRVRISLSNSVDQGGTGGLVELQEISSKTCLTPCQSAAAGTVIQLFAIGDSDGTNDGTANVNDSVGNPHSVPTAGQDVALRAFYSEAGAELQGQGTNLDLYFESTGGMRIGGACEFGQGFVRVQPDLGPPRYVFLSAGGAVRYTDCPACPH